MPALRGHNPGVTTAAPRLHHLPHHTPAVGHSGAVVWWCRACDVTWAYSGPHPMPTMGRVRARDPAAPPPCWYCGARHATVMAVTTVGQMRGITWPPP